MSIDLSPLAGEVILRVGGAGVCHSDVQVMSIAGFLGDSLPFTAGHEIAGWIDALGSGVTGLKESAVVAVCGLIGCGSCSACAVGKDRPGGAMCLTGLGHGTLTIGTGFDSLVPPEVRVERTFSGSRSDLINTIELARTGCIRAAVTRYGLDEVPSILEALNCGGEVNGRP